MLYVVVGAGIFGCVVAERIATRLKQPVLVVERRSHIGGNCYSEFDSETGIECHRYGSHIFHTKNRRVYDYLSNFTTLTHYRHRVLINHEGLIYQMPINLATINKLYGRELTPSQARHMISAEIATENMGESKNLEEKAISLVGRRIYEAFIRNYTSRQWNRHPRELPANIITRLPVRYNYNPDYFDDPWQGIPMDGYSAMFGKMLAQSGIEVRLNSDFTQIKDELPKDARIIYTGMPDALFAYAFGKLEYRSLRFEWERINVRDYQGTSVMNYSDQPFTRIHEFKHYHPERQHPYELEKTIICREYPADYNAGKEAFYPIGDEWNQRIYERYAEAAKKAGIILGGRLGAYKYWDMDKAIDQALGLVERLQSGLGSV